MKSKNTKPRVRVKRAKNHFGDREKLAEALDVTVECVMNWEREKKVFMPQLQAWKISMIAPDIVEWKSK